MSSIVIVFVALAVAYLVSALSVPVLVKIATRRQLLDWPDRDRHGHPLPVPRLGGVAVFIGLLAALVAAKLVGAAITERPSDLTPLTFALGAGGAILFLLGLYDDLRGVPPIAKIAAQGIAAFVVIQAGFLIDVIILPPNITLSLGVLAVPVTALWLIGVSNALNLVDGMDGLAGGVTLIALCVTTGAAIVLGNPDVAWQTFALIGALLGFLRYNVPPARIFLGDSGSLVVGFLLAVLCVKGASTPDGEVYALAPIFALSYPLLDTGIAIMRRFLRKEPLSRADGRHIHHQLRAIGLGPLRAVSVILLQSAGVGLLGLCVTFAPPELTVAVAVAGAAILISVFAYGTRWLRYHEFMEAGLSFTSVLRNARMVIRDKIRARDVALLVSRANDFEEVQSILRASAGDFGFTNLEVRLDTDPATSLRGLSTPARSTWRTEYPVGPLPQEQGDAGSAIAYLVITCGVIEASRQAGPERIARIVAPAIAAWLDNLTNPRQPVAATTSRRFRTSNDRQRARPARL